MNPGTELSLNELKEWNISLVNEVRNEKLNNSFTDSNNILWDVNSTAISNLNGVCTLIALGLVTGNQTWRDANNINHELAPSVIIQLAAEMAVYMKNCYTVSWQHKEAINNMVDIPTLQDYDIMTGW